MQPRDDQDLFQPNIKFIYMFYCLSDGEYIDISKADGNILSQRGFPHIKQLIMKNRQI